MQDILSTFSPRTQSLLGDSWANIGALASDVHDLRIESRVMDMEDTYQAKCRERYGFKLAPQTPAAGLELVE